MEIQQGVFNPELSNIAKETGGNLASIKINTDKLQFDASNYLKVNIVAGGAGNGAILDGVDSDIKATVFDFTNSNPLAVVLRDSNGDYVAVGGGTQYADGAVRGTATGTLMMGDDATNIQSVAVDASGHLQIDVLSGGGAGEQYVDDTVVNAAYKGNLVLGTDGTNYQILSVTAAGLLNIADGGGSVTVDGTFWQATQPVSGTFYQATQPISAASLPLPTGAATSAKQDTQDTSINTLLKPANTLAGVTTVATVTNLVQQGGVAISLNTGVRDTGTQRVTIATNDLVPVSGTFWQATQPISAASLPLPAGAATSALQGAGLPAALGAGGGVKIDGSGTALPVTGTITAVTAITNALPAGANAIGKLAANNGVDIGDVDVTSIAAGTNAIGNVGIIPRTTGGATPYKLISAATTNATSVKGSAGQVFMITASNVNAAARYLKLYNKASAPTVGTDTPVFTFIIPGNAAGAGTNIPVPTCGIAFSSGIAFALTTEITDAGTTAVAANEIAVNLGYV